jgi:anti-sigma B factor antagonist
MELQFEERDGVCIIRTTASELGADSSEELRCQLLAKLEECPWSAFDLSPVGFMDSSALGTLVAGLKTVRGRGHFRLFGLQPSIANLFRLTGMSRVFPTDEEEGASVEAIRGEMRSAA